jgi:kynurenine formamidase
VHGEGAYILENLANLDRLPPRGAFVVIAPLPIRGGTGAPARVIAFCEREIA